MKMELFPGTLLEKPKMAHKTVNSTPVTAVQVSAINCSLSPVRLPLPSYTAAVHVKYFLCALLPCDAMSELKLEHCLLLPNVIISGNPTRRIVVC